MTLNHADYASIRNDLSISVCQPAQLNFIKDKFRVEIDSSRTFDRIKNLKSLIRVLEKRDFFSEYNVGTLRILAELLRRNDCIRRIDDCVTNINRPIWTGNQPLIDNINGK